MSFSVEAKNRRIAFGICFVLVLMIWFVFGQTLTFDFVNYDDPQYVTENPLVLGGITKEGVIHALTHNDYSFYHPLTTLSHMLDVQIYGLNPAGFHLTNVVLHTASSLILFLVLRSMTGSLWRSALVAAVFAIHPLRAESVAWITERKDVLSGLFFMLTLAGYAGYVRRPFSFWRYGLVFLCMAASMLSKAILVTLPFVLLLLDFWPLRRFSPVLLSDSSYGGQALGRWGSCGMWKVGSILRQRLRRTSCGMLEDGKDCAENVSLVPVDDEKGIVSNERKNEHILHSTSYFQRYFFLLEKIPFFLLSAAVAFIMVLSSEESIASVARIPFGLRCSNAVFSYVNYLGCLLVPSKLFLLYPYPEGGIPLWVSGGSLLFLVSVTVVVIRLFREKPFLTIGWLWYLGMLFPMIGMIQVGSQASADRYTYFSQIGVVIALIWFFAEQPFLQRHRGLVRGFVVLIVVGLMVSSRVQVSYWKDSISLWSRTLACVEPHSVAHNNLGIALKQTGLLEEARRHFKRAIELRPGGVEAYNNLAGAYVQEEDWAGAESWYLLALEKEPGHAVIHQNYAVVLVNQGRADEAIREFKMALEIDPGLLGACNGLVKALAQTGDLSGAILVLERAISRHPENATLHYNLGIIFEGNGLLESATVQYEEAVRLEPDALGARARLNALILKRSEADSLLDPLGK